MSDAKFDETYYAENGQSGDRPALWMYERLWKRYCNLNGPVLEFGGGAGWFAKRLAKHTKVYACETNTYARESLSRLVPSAIHIKALSELPDDTVSSIVALHVLEHIRDGDLAALFKEFHRVSQPDTRCLFVMPDLSGRAHEAKGGAWSAFTDPTHINLKRAADWSTFFRDAGFRPHKQFADGYYDFPYGSGALGRTIGDSLRVARTGLQFLLARPMLKVGDGENVVFILEKPA